VIGIDLEYRGGYLPLRSILGEEYMPTVTKVELAHTIAQEMGLTRVLALKVVDTLFEAIREAIQKGTL